MAFHIKEAAREAGELRRALDDALDRLIAADREVARVSARRMRALDEVRMLHEQSRSARSGSPAVGAATGAAPAVVFRTSDDIDARSLRAEVALALRIGEREAETRLAEARILVHDLPATWNAFVEGRMSERHARVTVDETAGLDTEDRCALDQRAAVTGAQLNPARFRQQLRRARERLAPASKTTRTRAALADRCTWLEPGRDGMAVFSVAGPAVELTAIDDRVRSMASAQRGVEGETRTTAQLEADAAIALLLARLVGAGPAAGAGEFQEWAAGVFDIRPTVHLTVPAMSLLDMAREDPGRESETVGGELPDLDGYGPIDPVTAARWMAVAPSLTRILVHPFTGALLALDRTKYRPTDDLRAWLRARDVNCRFPGCGAAARRCEIDHTAEWCADGGSTNHDNLCCLCPGHHTLKSSTAWRSTQIPDGTVHWTTPLNRHYSTHPGREVATPPPDPVSSPDHGGPPDHRDLLDAGDLIDTAIEEYWKTAPAWVGGMLA